MIITYLRDSLTNKNLELSAPEIADLPDSLASYSAITVTGYLNCSDTTVSMTIEATDILHTDGDFYIDTDSKTLFVNPSLFLLPQFIDSIITLEVKLHKITSGYILMKNCIFVDVSYKCKVASLLQNIITENEDREDNEKISTIIHLIHYGLVNGSNCGCNCSELCDLFTQLTDLLSDIDPKITNPCGCK